MRSRLAAIGVVALGALMPLLFWVSAGVIALITLRRGIREGILILAGAVAILLPVYAGLLGAPMALLQPIALTWLPVMVLAHLLRVSVSLGRTLEWAGGIAALAVGAFYLVQGDPAVFWQDLLGQLAQLLGSDGPQSAWNQAAAELAPRLTGLWIANMLGITVICLLLGRWWQAVLYNPGGFREEFHALRLSRVFATLTLGMVLVGLVMGPGLFADLGTVMVSVFLLQALALAHHLVARRGWHVGWLIALYFMLPLAIRPVALIGLADAFVDFRNRTGFGDGSHSA